MGKILKGLFIAVVISCVVSLFFVVVFSVLYVKVKPPSNPTYSSIVVGGDMQSYYTWECENIELNSFTPNIRIVAYLQKADLASRRYTESIERILKNHSLQVGYDSNQLTYYGVPVLTGDKVNLFIRASSMSPSVQSVTVLVYDAEGFGQFINYTSTNASSLYSYNLGMNCLRSMSGCIINSVVISNGWLYFVFKATPTPSTLVVSIEATVRKYDTPRSNIEGMCTLYESSSSCFLQVPTRVVKKGESSHVVYFPFIVTYKTYPLNNVPNMVPSSQSLNTSVDLSTTCTRSYNIIFLVFLCVFSAISVTTCMPVVLVVLLVGYYICIEYYTKSKCRRKNKKRHRSNIQFETISRTHDELDDDIGCSMTCISCCCCEYCPDLDCQD